MYGFEEQIYLSPSDILQKVTQEQIFEFALEEPIHMGDRYKSPCRTDKKAGCRFEVRPDGEILFVDFGEKYLTGRTHRSCFGLVMDKYKITMSSCITLLCQRFGLSCNPSDYNSPIPVKDMRVAPKENRIRSVITYVKRPIEKRDKVFLSESLIKPEHILEDNVHPISSFTLTNEKGRRTINLFKIAFAIDFIDQCKIYQPYSDPEYRFISSCDENKIGNIDNLPATGDELIIKKSYRDHRLLRNLDIGLNVIWFQNEGCVPSMEILTNLVQRFKQITIFFDNDFPGVIAAMKIVNILNSIRIDCARMVHLPIFRNKSMLWKDPTEFYIHEGRKELLEVLKQIGIYEQVA